MSTSTIITDKMVFGGDCIGKIGGKTVFVPYSIPGEKEEIEIVTSKRDYDVARIVSVSEPSPHRVSAPCPYYGSCGGCNMMHIDSSYQRELRASVLSDCFARCGVAIPAVQVISGPDTGYRCRFQLNDGGLTGKNSSTVIPVTHCIVADSEINEYLASVPPSQRPSGRVHLFGADCVVSAGGSEKSRTAAAPEPVPYTAPSAAAKKKNKNIRVPVKRFAGTVLSPEDIVTVDLLGKKISFDVRGFFQSNMTVLASALGALCGGLEGDEALDMYSGCGTFSVFLADHFKNVTLVEHNRDALVFAEQNMAGKKHASYGMSGEKWVEQFSSSAHFDAAVVDPPRSGMEEAVCAYFCRSHIPVIRSLSCDPATHARDASRLTAAGYQLTSLALLDFYPNTCHIESLATFIYKG